MSMDIVEIRKTTTTKQLSSKDDSLKRLLNPKCVDVSDEKNEKVYKEVLKEGGRNCLDVPTEGCEVVVHTIGLNVDGTILDENQEGRQFSFRVGSDNVNLITGLKQGILSMTKGEQAKLYIHPDYCDYGFEGKILYRNKPAPPIICKVTILDVKSEDLTKTKSGALLRHRVKLKTEIGDQFPQEGDKVEGTEKNKMSLLSKYKGFAYDQRDVTFTMGMGIRSSIPYGIEMALFKFKEGELAHLTLRAEYAFGSIGLARAKIPPNTTVMYLVQLKKLTKIYHIYPLDPLPKCADVLKVMTHGKKFFTIANKYFSAAYQFKMIIDSLKPELELPDNIEQTNLLMRAACLNKAVCHLMLYEPVEAKEYAEMALQIKQSDPSSLYIRALCNIGITDGLEARTDLLMVRNLDGNYKPNLVSVRIRQSEKMIKEDWEAIEDGTEETVGSFKKEKFSLVELARKHKETIDMLKKDEDFASLLIEIETR